MNIMSDAILDVVRELVADQRAIPAVVVAAILARLDKAEGRAAAANDHVDTALDQQMLNG
jgi:CheY-like chemotaxis protein